MNLAIVILAAMLVAAIVYIVILQSRSASLDARTRYAEKALQEQQEYFAKTDSECSLRPLCRAIRRQYGSRTVRGCRRFSNP